MFEHMMKRHNVLFVYVGAESPLRVGTNLPRPDVDQDGVKVGQIEWQNLVLCPIR